MTWLRAGGAGASAELREMLTGPEVDRVAADYAQDQATATEDPLRVDSAKDPGPTRGGQ